MNLGARGMNMMEIEKSQLKELLLKNWMTHDGMWFYHSMNDSGIAKANQINKAAIKSLAAVEIERIRKAFDLKEMRTFHDVKALCDAAFGVLTDHFMGFSYSFPSANVLQWEMGHCFAHDGMERLGVIEHYECGVIYRVGCWFQSLGIEYTLTPRIDGCIMHSTGNCRGEFSFHL